MSAALPLIGHRDAEAAFISANESGKLHHAWLIEGPAGIGKARLAMRLAAYMLGARGPANSPLDAPQDDPVMQAYLAGGHPDQRTAEDAGRATGLQHHVPDQSRLEIHSPDHSLSLPHIAPQALVGRRHSRCAEVC